MIETRSIDLATFIMKQLFFLPTSERNKISCHIFLAFSSSSHNRVSDTEECPQENNYYDAHKKFTISKLSHKYFAVKSYFKVVISRLLQFKQHVSCFCSYTMRNLILLHIRKGIDVCFGRYLGSAQHRKSFGTRCQIRMK